MAPNLTSNCFLVVFVTIAIIYLSPSLLQTEEEQCSIWVDKSCTDNLFFNIIGKKLQQNRAISVDIQKVCVTIRLLMEVLKHTNTNYRQTKAV